MMAVMWDSLSAVMSAAWMVLNSADTWAATTGSWDVTTAATTVVLSAALSASRLVGRKAACLVDLRAGRWEFSSVVSRAALMVAVMAGLTARTMGGTMVAMTVALWVDYSADE